MASRHERPIPRDRLSYRQIVSRWFAEYTLLESTYLYEVYTDGSQYFINWLGTTLAGQRSLYASEWGEDYLALHRMVPKRWLRHIRNVYNRYGNERNGVYHIGYSRGGGTACVEMYFSDRDAGWTDLRSVLTAFRRCNQLQGRITARPLLSACPAFSQT